MIFLNINIIYYITYTIIIKTIFIKEIFISSALMDAKKTADNSIKECPDIGKL